MNARALVILATAILVVPGRVARGQGIAVQQPVVQRFGVDAVVSVPDRGSLSLGGVGAAAAGSRRASSLGPGTTYGGRTSGSALSVHVTIHDFGAMDRALLQQGSGLRKMPPAGTRADAACRQLLSRPVQSGTARGAPPDRFGRPGARGATAAGRNAAFYLGKARRCEERGEASVARMFYRMAARYGSDEAAAKLPQCSPENNASP